MDESGSSSSNSNEPNETNLKILTLLTVYQNLEDKERSQFISSLIGTFNLLFDMGKWFPNSLEELFKHEFEKGKREKCLIELSNNTLFYKYPNQIFWVRVGRYGEQHEQDILFQNIMKSKDYTVSETTCELNYNHENCIFYNQTEITAEYPLAFGEIKYNEAKHLGEENFFQYGSIINVEGFLATKVSKKKNIITKGIKGIKGINIITKN